MSTDDYLDLRTVTTLGSAWSTKWLRAWTRRLRPADRVATSASWSRSSRNTSSASAATEAICRSALLSAKLVTASSSRSRTVGTPCSSCSFTLLRWTGPTTRCTNGMARDVTRNGPITGPIDWLRRRRPASHKISSHARCTHGYTIIRCTHNNIRSTRPRRSVAGWLLNRCADRRRARSRACVPQWCLSFLLVLKIGGGGETVQTDRQVGQQCRAGIVRYR